MKPIPSEFLSVQGADESCDKGRQLYIYAFPSIVAL